jgi:DNA-binding CsgD family transcriptional regulator
MEDKDLGTSDSSRGRATLEAALGALPIPAYTNDVNGFVTWQNAAARAISGDLRGMHYSRAVPAEELPRARETWAAVTISGVTRRRTGAFRGANGGLVHLEVITAPIREGGEVVGTFGIAIPLSDSETPRPPARLSPRQLEVLRLLVQGKTTNQIAGELHIAPETVRNHVRSVLKGLGVRTRLDAAVTALRLGLVSLDFD